MNTQEAAAWEFHQFFQWLQLPYKEFEVTL